MSDDKHMVTMVAPEAEQHQLTHPLVAQVLARNPDAATLRELMALQQEWEREEGRKAFARALVRLKADMPVVLDRDALVHFTTSKGATHYRHTSLAAAMDAVTPALTAHGFSLSWRPETTGQDVTVTCILTHSSGHRETCAITAPRDTSGSKSASQSVASTITLLQRYTALSLLGIATADMSDPSPQDAKSPRVDAARNLRAVGEITRRGRSVADAVAAAGRPVAEWTGVELHAVREWLTSTLHEVVDPTTGEIIPPGSSE